MLHTANNRRVLVIGWDAADWDGLVARVPAIPVAGPHAVPG